MVAIAVLGLVASMVLGVMWGGYVLSILWGWFMVGQFGLPPLGIAHAIGVMLVVGLLTHQMPRGEADTATVIAFGFVAPLLSLGVGWIVKSFL